MKKHYGIREDDYYLRLPLIKDFSAGLEEGIRPVPQDWYIAITDIVDSTKAIEAGKYKQVNVSGALPIIALARMYDSLKRPFVFGGDGMTFLIDGDHYEEAQAILSRTIRDVQVFFGLHLRAALIPMSEIYRRGGSLALSKHQVSEHYTQAFFHGSGIRMAEDMLKSPGEEDAAFIIEAAKDSRSVNYKGFTCRWADIPGSSDVTAALIVEGRNGMPAAEVIRLIESVLGDSSSYHPLKVENMNMGGSRSDWSLTPLVMSRGRKSPAYFFRAAIAWVEIQLAKIAMALKLPLKQDIYQMNRLREQNIANSDFRKYEGALKMIFSADESAVDALEQALDKEVQAGRIFYGVHRSEEAHMTCIATLESGDDVHFIDATGGGYALAAAALKKQKARA